MAMAHTTNVGSDEGQDEMKMDKMNAPVRRAFLSREDCINGKWMFFNDNGYIADIRLLENGKLSGYSHKNERTWELRTIANGYTMLEFYGDGHKLTCRFISSVLDANQKWSLHGPFTPNKSWRHYLIQYELQSYFGGIDSQCTNKSITYSN